MWLVRYRKNSVEYIGRHPSVQVAIQAACELLDDGYEVYAMGLAPLGNSIGKDMIARIYDLRMRTKTTDQASPKGE